VVILANALAAQQLTVSQHLPLTPVRGQIAQFETNTALKKLNAVLCYGGYLTPAFGTAKPQTHCLGASFWPKNTNTEVTVSDHVHNQQLIAQFLPQLPNNYLVLHMARPSRVTRSNHRLFTHRGSITHLREFYTRLCRTLNTVKHSPSSPLL
jgi:glycine/D-amino acid oxidase-like deaminating enzyme